MWVNCQNNGTCRSTFNKFGLSGLLLYIPAATIQSGYIALNMNLLIRDHLKLACIMKPSMEQFFWCVVRGSGSGPRKVKRVSGNGILMAEYHIILSKNHILPSLKAN